MGAAISYKYTNNYSKLHGKRTMTVVIDENITDLASCCTYEDDAVGMPSGKSIEATNAWQEFFGYKPCLFKNGRVVGYLNPNDYSKFEDGSSADITSGDAGDVMIEFPKRGLKISKTNDNKLRVTITDNIEDQTYTYYAFTRDKLNYSPFNHQELNQVDNFYLGVYPSYFMIGGELQSKSGTRASTTSGLDEKYGVYGNVEHYAHELVRNKGTGYELMTFFQLVYIQAMYLLQFKNPKVTSAFGYDGNRTDVNRLWCGDGDQLGLVYANDSSGGTNPSKLFGMEHLSTNANQLIDGLIIDGLNHNNWRTCIACDGFDSVPDIMSRPQRTGWTELDYRFQAIDGRNDNGWIKSIALYKIGSYPDDEDFPAFLPNTEASEYGTYNTTYGFRQNLEIYQQDGISEYCTYVMGGGYVGGGPDGIFSFIIQNAGEVDGIGAYARISYY